MSVSEGTDCLWVKVRSVCEWRCGLSVSEGTDCLWVKVRTVCEWRYRLSVSEGADCLWVKVRASGGAVDRDNETTGYVVCVCDCVWLCVCVWVCVCVCGLVGGCVFVYVCVCVCVYVGEFLTGRRYPSFCRWTVLARVYVTLWRLKLAWIKSKESVRTAQ
jgi:hypothetical protein